MSLTVTTVGVVRLRARWRVGIALLVAVALCLAATPMVAAADGQPEYAKPVSARLNATGKVITMPVPFAAGNQSLGDLVISIDADDHITVPKPALLGMLSPLVDPAAVARLAGLPDQNGKLPLEAIKAAGFNVDFDRSQLTLTYKPKGADRSTGDLSLTDTDTGTLDLAAPPAVSEPSDLAGFVNFTSGVNRTWGNASITDQTALTFDIQPLLRISQIAIAGDWNYQSAAEPFVCPIGAYCLADQAGGLKRQYTRLLYDRPQDLLRLEAGDTEPIGTEFQNPTDTLGFSIEHSARKLAPGQHQGPMEGTTFRLDRPSDVDVIINGAVVRHMHLEPGPYNLRDIPLQAGGNEVTLEITDDTGQHRTQSFTTFADPGLLAAGASEWAVSGGLPSYVNDNERVYRSSYLTGGGYFRYGLSKALTAEVQAQADNDVAEGGGRLLASLPLGYATFGAAASLGRLGTGLAADWTWSLTNARILRHGGAQGQEALSFGIDYRSDRFHAPGEYIATSGNIIYPQYEYSWRFTGFYSTPLTETISATLSGRYSIASGVSASSFLTPYSYTGDRYGLDLSVTAPVNSWINGSVSLGYGNDSYIDPTRDAPDFHAGFRLTLRPDEHTSVQASYDTLNQQATVSASRQYGTGNNRWDANVDVTRDGLSGTGTADASIAYTGNRFEARATQTQGYAGGLFDGASAAGTGLQQTTASFGTALAFAGGRFAVGPPIRGDAFAIVYPHESLAGKVVTVGDPQYVRGYADGFGPAVIGNLPAYLPTNLPVEVADLPLGYSLGQGSFDLRPGYRTGYALEVGSSHSVSAYGTLVGADGQPISLLTGSAHPDGGKSHEVAVFTNAAGRFGAEGLAPGRWIIEMATEDAPTRFAIDIPPGTNGLFKAGTLNPIGG